jgi:hypothetical protein
MGDQSPYLQLSLDFFIAHIYGFNFLFSGFPSLFMLFLLIFMNPLMLFSSHSSSSTTNMHGSPNVISKPFINNVKCRCCYGRSTLKTKSDVWKHQDELLKMHDLIKGKKLSPNICSSKPIRCTTTFQTPSSSFWYWASRCDLSSFFILFRSRVLWIIEGGFIFLGLQMRA